MSDLALIGAIRRVLEELGIEEGDQLRLDWDTQRVSVVRGQFGAPPSDNSAKARGW